MYMILTYRRAQTVCSYLPYLNRICCLAKSMAKEPPPPGLSMKVRNNIFKGRYLPFKILCDKTLEWLIELKHQYNVRIK